MFGNCRIDFAYFIPEIAASPIEVQKTRSGQWNCSKVSSLLNLLSKPTVMLTLDKFDQSTQAEHGSSTSIGGTAGSGQNSEKSILQSFGIVN